MTSKPLYVAKSPASILLPGEVVLDTHTWYGHIKRGHPDVQLLHVKRTMSNPCYICSSATEPGTHVFVSELNVNMYGDALRVAVHPDGSNQSVRSAYYSGSQSHGTIIWNRGDG